MTSTNTYDAIIVGAGTSGGFVSHAAEEKVRRF